MTDASIIPRRPTQRPARPASPPGMAAAVNGTVLALDALVVLAVIVVALNRTQILNSRAALATLRRPFAGIGLTAHVVLAS